MKRKIAGLLAASLLISTMTACVDSADDLMHNIQPSPIDAVELSDVSNAAVCDFAVRLFQQSVEDGKNTLISPMSVLTALSMTANGADGNTLSQMEAVLGMPVAELNGWVHSYMEKLPEEDKYKLSLANSIWFTDEESFTVNEGFLQINADYYGAGIYRTPFDDTTCRQINDWVADNTDGMIKNILDEIPDSAVMYLINALAFDAEWQNIYKEWEIRDGTFTKEDGTEQDVELMYSSEYKYLEDEHATGFMKYYADRKYAFAALLPEEGVSVAEYAASLDGEQLHSLFTDVQNTAVDAAIPKFETEYKVEMSDLLADMGMTDAFTSAADFTKLGQSTDGYIKINRVIQQTFISLDEKGTKAGAATIVEATTESAAEPVEAKKVILDRPFVYMLLDCETNIPFFIGTMMDMEG